MESTEQGKESKVAKDASTTGVSDGKTTSSGAKIFIGGLSRETTTEKLTKHFKKYGKITDSVIMKDRGSGHPRGFGFVTFSDPSVCDKVLQEAQLIDGRTVDCKRSIPRENMSAVKGPKTKKIFVGGIPTSITEEEFKKHFSEFGKVVEHQIMLEHSSGRSRGFGFIVFDSEQTVDDLLAQGTMHDFAGKQVELKKAEPKRAQDSGSDPVLGPSRFGPSGRGDFDRYNDGYGLSSDFGYSSALYRSGYGSGLGSYGAYGGSFGHYGGGYEGSFGMAGYGGNTLGGGYGSGLGSYGGSVGGGYTGSGLLGGYNDDAYGVLGYSSGYDGGYGGYSGRYGGARGYGSSNNGRYHPYGRS